MRKMATCCLIFSLLISLAPTGSAKSQSDWSNLKNFINEEIAIKTADGVTAFGVLSFVDDSEVMVRLADQERLSARETSFKRAEVTRVWRATLRFGETKTGRGALIGLGAGLGAGYVAALVLAKQEKGPPHGAALFPLVGAGVGALIGSSKLKDHKKKKLIFSI